MIANRRNLTFKYSTTAVRHPDQGRDQAMKEERAAAVKPVLGSATCSGLPSLRAAGLPPYRIRQPRHAALRGAELTATELSIKGALILARRGSIRRAGYHAI